MSPRKHGADTHKKAQRLVIGPGAGLHPGPRRQEISNNLLGTPPVFQPLIPDETEIQRDHFDRLASALLDSPTPEKYHPNGLASHPTDYGARTSPAGPCPVSRRLNGPLDKDKHRRGLRSSSSQDPFGPPGAETRHFSPGRSRQPLLHPTNGQIHFPSAHFSKSGPIQSLPTSHLDSQEPQSNDDSHHQRPKRRYQGRGLSGRVPLSRTAPLHGPSGGQFVNSGANVCDAQQNLKGMLAVPDIMAASKSSKEPCIERRSRAARLSQRISTKVSDAWSRFQGRGAQTEANMLKISGPMELRGANNMGRPHLLQGMQGMHAPQYSPGAIKKSRSSVAVVNESRRTPITSSTMSLATRSPPNPNPIHLGFDDEVVLPTVDSNPFEDNTEFDDDLEGVLPHLPLAASTPRLRRKRAFRFDRRPSTRPKLDTSLVMALPSDSGSSTKSQHVAVSKGTCPSRSLKITPRVQLAPADQEVFTKKHPSPSKADLDHMASQLRGMGVRRIDDDLDEIAHSIPRPWSSRETLAPRDKNQRIRRTIGRTEESEEGRTPTPTGKTRIPCPHGSTRLDTRFGLVKHPQDPQACEVDELAFI
ncbi:hypothetical protein ACRALDRAFT_2040813 [Sodiomyces alcalophilus JCM 7366]|uniref:uncharacterized protein n=1 Tax=Sodiomyces alcalophilus JCM 7366 TaxID=591952 RepID=UPI0039B3F4DD